MDDSFKSRGWKVLIAATGINLVSGMLYIWSVISKALVDQLNWTSKEASLPYTIATISFVIAMVVFGGIQDNKGPRFVGTIGAVLLGGGFLISGFTTSPIIMIITMGIITGAGMGVLNIATTASAVKWFPPEKKGMITGIVVGGVGASSIIYSPLANYLIENLGIAKTFIYIGAIALVVAVSLAQILKDPPVDKKLKSNVNLKANIPSRDDLTSQEMLKTRDFYILWVLLGLSSAAGLMIIGHISNIAKIQAGWEGGFVLVMLLALFNTSGRFLGGTISDKIGRFNLMKGIFILQAINMFLFSFYSNIPLLIIGVAIAGLCYGAGFSVFPATVSDLYGISSFGINYGLVFTGWGFGGIIGPMTGAALFDATGSYNLAYGVAGILLIISIITVYVYDRKRQPKKA